MAGYRVGSGTDRFKTCNNGTVVDPTIPERNTGAPTTNIDGGAAIGVNNAGAELTEVELERNYTDENFVPVGTDGLMPLQFVPLPNSISNNFFTTTDTNYPGMTAFRSDGMTLRADDVVKFGGNDVLTSTYRVLSNKNNVCTINHPYSVPGELPVIPPVNPVYLGNGEYNDQSAPHISQGSKGNPAAYRWARGDSFTIRE